MEEQFCDVGRGITLCYETFGKASDPAALLIMGLGTQMVAWHEDFCRDLATRGYYVVRFDNRDIGRSTHVGGPPPTITQLLLRSKRAARYTLADMADDAAGLLRELGLAPAHVIGASMGGMIAQTLAARHPDQVRSLTSIMSNTGALTNGQPALRLYPFFLRRRPVGLDEYVAHFARLFAAIGSTGMPRDPDEIRALAGISYERDHDIAGPGRQLAAIIASGDRTRELRKVARADAGRARHRGPAGQPLGRAGDGACDQRRQADERRRHGPRPAARGLAAADRRDRREHAQERVVPRTTTRPCSPPARPSRASPASPRGVPQSPCGRRRLVGSPAVECARTVEQTLEPARMRTSQCRSWRQWERRYGQRPCSERSMRPPWQPDTLIVRRPFPDPYYVSQDPSDRPS